MALTAHSNSRIPEEQVLAVPEPAWTNTWHPISHKRCVKALEEVVKTYKLEVAKKEYSLSKDGFKCFGSWALGNGKDKTDISQSIVFRNSTNKYFSFGLAAGSHAWVCDNLAFSGEFVEFRRHTSGMNDEELGRVIANGMEIILPRMKSFQKWHESLHEVKLIPPKMKELCYIAIVKEVIPKRQINEFDKLLFEENPVYNNRELFGFHGACTQLYRDKSMVTTDGRQKVLFDFIEEKYGKLLPSAN